MKITKFVVYNRAELVDRLRMVKLIDSDITPYSDAKISIETYDPSALRPAQLYVLSGNITRTVKLRELFLEHSIDIFKLDGFVRFWLDGNSEPIDLLPPVIEMSEEGTGDIVPLINDGMHRAYSAIIAWSPLNVVTIGGVNKKTPYYAYPIPGNNPWGKVTVLDSIQKGYIKKWHRVEESRPLYRDFNSAFINVGGPRPEGATS